MYILGLDWYPWYLLSCQEIHQPQIYMRSCGCLIGPDLVAHTHTSAATLLTMTYIVYIQTLHHIEYANHNSEKKAYIIIIIYAFFSEL